MKTYRLLASGSSGLSNDLTKFVSILGQKIAKKTNMVLATGGLKQIKERAFFATQEYDEFVGMYPDFKRIFKLHGKNKKHKRYIDIDKIMKNEKRELGQQCIEDLKDRAKNTFATDYIIAESFKKSLEESDVEKRIITYRPQTHWKKDINFSYGEKRPVRHSNYRLRRYFMVHNCDAVITIEGIEATREIIDFAVILKKPILPLPFTGGVSRAAWKEYKSEIISHCPDNKEDKRDMKTIEEGTPKHKENDLANTCVRMLRRRLKPKLFVAMKFSRHPLNHDRVFEIIRDVADKKGYEAIRIDKERFSGNIVEVIKDTIRTSDAILADLTGYNANVFYELGISHTLGKSTILTVHNANGKVPRNVPFDIRIERILAYNSLKALKGLLMENI